MLTFPILHNECLKLNPGYLAAMPGMTKDEYENLKADIKEYGIANPILVDAKTMEVIDGHHRLKIAEELEMTCPFTFILDKDDNEETNPAILKWLAVSLNINRRHLGTRERQEIVMLADEAGLTVKEVAKTLGVHQNTVLNDRRALGLGSEARSPAGRRAC